MKSVIELDHEETLRKISGEKWRSLGYTALALALSLFLSTCCGLVKRILKSIE
jgi:hypothetical protein